MPDVYKRQVETHTISYESSKKPVTTQIVEATFSYVNGATGEAITEAIPISSDPVSYTHLVHEMNIRYRSCLPSRLVMKPLLQTV